MQPTKWLHNLSKLNLDSIELPKHFSETANKEKEKENQSFQGADI
jgi:hypothetical protein